MHAYHDSLPGYDPAQILHDGCEECEDRAVNVARAIGHLDAGNFERAWVRAAERVTCGLRNVSAAEAPLLNALWAVQVQLERRGVPIGHIPTGSSLTFATGVNQ